MGPELSPWSLRAGRPSAASGIAVAVAGVALATLVIYPLSEIAPVVSLSVVYLPAVVVVSAYWGLRLGLATAIASAAAFNFFHLPPVGTLHASPTGATGSALAAFVVVAVATGLIAELARTRAQEADAATPRGRPGGRARPGSARRAAGRRGARAGGAALAVAIGVDGAALELGPVAPTDRQVAFALRDPARRTGRSARSCCRRRCRRQERERVARAGRPGARVDPVGRPASGDAPGRGRRDHGAAAQR